MNKVKEFMTKGQKPLLVLGLVAVLYLLHVTVTTLLYEGSWFAHLLRITGTMLAFSVGIQVGRVAVKKGTVTPLDLLQFIERSVMEIVQTVKVVYYNLHRFRRPILLMVLLYVAESGAAAWALEQWGGTIPAATQETILSTLHAVYNTAFGLTVVLGTVVLAWAFIRIAIRNHFSNSEELVASIVTGLEKEGIEITYSHAPNGRCYLNVEHLLNVLANNNVKTSARSELYWLIKNNVELLHRVEFFPFGMPKTPAQQLAEYLKQEQTQQQG
jgi:hypothetical protein